MAGEGRINKDTMIADAVRLCPAAAEVFGRHGMGCLVCMAAQDETVEQGAEMHEIDVQALVDELNAACSEQ